MTYSTIEGGAKDVTVFAVKGADGGRKAVLVTDYRSGSAEDISVEVDGVPADAKVSAWVHDYARDFESVPVEFEGEEGIILEDTREGVKWKRA